MGKTYKLTENIHFTNHDKPIKNKKLKPYKKKEKYKILDNFDY